MKEMRLDKYVASYTDLSRKMAKQAIHRGRVAVGEDVIRQEDYKLDSGVSVFLDGEKIRGEACVYYMMNKPSGVVSASSDNVYSTVVELIEDADLTGHRVFPVGRLDRDTEGLLFLTDDGTLAHRLLSPKYHVDKTYYVEYEGALSDEGKKALACGMDIGEKKLTKPARWEETGAGRGFLTISEGKFHQVKRMIAGAGGQVTCLKRVSMAGISLDEALKPGEYRRLTENEIGQLQEAAYGKEKFLCGEERKKTGDLPDMG